MTQMPSRQDLLQSLVYTLLRRKVMIAVTFVVVLALVMFAGYLVTPTWEGTALLMVQTNSTSPVAAFSERYQPGQSNTVSSHVQSVTLLLLSREVAYEMVKRFHLDEQMRRKAQEPANFREFSTVTLAKTLMLPVTVLRTLGVLREAETDWAEEAAENFRSGLAATLEAEVVEGTDVVQITIHGESPEQATEIAGAIAVRAQELMQELTSRRYRIAQESYQTQLDDVAARLSSAEKALEAFSREHGGAQLDDIISLRTARLEALRGQVERLAADQEARRRGLEALASGDVDAETGVLAAGILAAQGSEAELRTLWHQRRSELAVMLTEKTPDHPDVQNLRSELSQLENSLVTEARAAIAATDARLAALARETTALKSGMDDLTKLQHEHERLVLQVQVQREVWQGMLGRLEELRATAETGIGDLSFKTLDTAFVSPLADSDWPSWLIVVVVGLFVAAASGVGLAFLVEHWRDPVKGRRELWSRGICVVGVVPPVRR